MAITAQQATSILHKRPTYEDVIQYIEQDPDKIKYPNREAKFLRNSFQLSFLDTFNHELLEKQQDNLAKARIAQEEIKKSAQKNKTSVTTEEALAEPIIEPITQPITQRSAMSFASSLFKRGQPATEPDDGYPPPDAEPEQTNPTLYGGISSLGGALAGFAGSFFKPGQASSSGHNPSAESFRPPWLYPPQGETPEDGMSDYYTATAGEQTDQDEQNERIAENVRAQLNIELNALSQQQQANLPKARLPTPPQSVQVKSESSSSSSRNSQPGVVNVRGSPTQSVQVKSESSSSSSNSQPGVVNVAGRSSSSSLSGASRISASQVPVPSSGSSKATSRASSKASKSSKKNKPASSSNQ